MATFDQFIASLEQEFGEQGKGKPFEVFCKWFLENDPEWSKTVDKVWLWDDYPHKWQRQDLGTDLVFRDNEGLIWAVQAKCYAEHRTTTKGDIDSFLNDMGRTGVDRGLWMQSNPAIGINAKYSLLDRDKQVLVIDLHRFRDAQIDYPEAFADLYQAKVKAKPTPDLHQIKAIKDVTAGLQTVDRGQMIMACGTGKTFTTLWIKEALEAHTTLVLLPSLSLLSQTMREWAWAGNTDFDILNVCSDKSVGKKTEDMDPADAPFPVTSEVDEIATFLKKPEPKVIFCTYQSSDLIAQAQRDEAVPTFDLAVADEAHRCAGKADAGFAMILDGEKIRASKRLFTTATPRYFGKAIKDAAKAKDLAVIGMDNEAVFGPVVHKLTFGQAIAQDLLTDYQVVIVGVDEPMVKEWIENYEIVTTGPDESTDARTLAAKIGLLKAVKDYDLQRIISFHSRVAGAKTFSEELVEVSNLIEVDNRPEGTFLSDYVSGQMKAGDRKEKIDKLKALEGYDRGILTNARCLAEGVDVPSLDGVAFIDPKGSQVEIIQAVGRAIRKVRGAKVQKKGTIVMPVFIEEGDDAEDSIEASNFKPVWDVLKALRAHDEVLADTLDQYRTDMAKGVSKNKERISDKIIFDMPTTVDTGFAEALRTVLVEGSTASWEFWYGLLEVFKERKGHCVVPVTYKVDDNKLGSWIVSQRSRKDRLSPASIERLDVLGFVWNIHEEAWENAFQKLQQFQAREGHCNVPTSHKETGFKLGGWVGKQRDKKSTLSVERIERLDALGFVWDPLKVAWEAGYGKLHQFHSREAHSKVPQSHKEDGFKLGGWVSTQRSNMNKLSPERKERLDALGFVWDTLEEAWEEGFQKLQQFQKREGHCVVLQSHWVDGFKLGGWVGNQRSTKATLSPERIERLDALGFVWDTREEAWEEGFQKLQKFYVREGHCKVPASYQEDGFKLGGWVGVQRQTKDNLSPERKDQLDAFSFIWNKYEADWEEGFDSLERFKSREGHCKVPQLYREDGFKLGGWIATQRRAKDDLSPERKERLDALGFVWDTLEEAWEEGFQKLQQFFSREGHSKVPASYQEDDYKLGVWSSRQRSSVAAMSPERKQLLDEVGFVWDLRAHAWEEGFTKLLQFKDREGHCLVPRKYEEDGHKLGNWVGNQRTRALVMSPERRKRLDDLGFVWDPIEQQWEECFTKLLQFKDREGHCHVPDKHKEDGFKLGSWVGYQRRHELKMSPEHKQRLDDIGFIWDTRKSDS